VDSHESIEGVRIVDFNTRTGENPARITDALQLGGGRIDFALLMAAVGLGIEMAHYAPLLLLLLLCTAGMVWSFSYRVEFATKSWLLNFAYNWAQLVPAQPAEAGRVETNVRETANVVPNRDTQEPTRLGAAQARRVAKLTERTPAHSQERDALITKTQIAMKRRRDAVELALHDFAVIERNQGNRLH
jgi:hypothetical protein